MTIQTAMLIETLLELGADIRWASCNIFSTQDHAGVAIAKAGTAAVFAWKGETLEDYWWCTEQALIWPDGSGPDLIVDDGGDATLYIHQGVKFEKNPSLLDRKYDNRKMQIIVDRMRYSLQSSGKHWHKVATRILGVSEETTMIAGKMVVIYGYGDVGKGCAQSMRGFGARVVITEIDPISALQAAMEGYEVKLLDDVIKVITGNYMARMKNEAIVCKSVTLTAR